MLTVWYMLTQAAFVFFVSITIPDFTKRTKANRSRLVLIALLLVLSVIIKYSIGGK